MPIKRKQKTLARTAEVGPQLPLRSATSSRGTSTAQWDSVELLVHTVPIAGLHSSVWELPPFIFQIATLSLSSFKVKLVYATQHSGTFPRYYLERVSKKQTRCNIPLPTSGAAYNCRSFSLPSKYLMAGCDLALKSAYFSSGSYSRILLSQGCMQKGATVVPPCKRVLTLV